MDAVKRMLAGALALLAVYLLLTGPLAARRAEAVEAARMRGVELDAPPRNAPEATPPPTRSEEHTSELQSR